MKSYFVILFFLALFGIINSCEKPSNSDSNSLTNEVCGGSSPVENLAWLKKLTTELENSPFCHNISRAGYKGQTVYILANCSPNVSSVLTLYDCLGKEVKLSADDYQNLTFTGNVEQIWRNE